VKAIDRLLGAKTVARGVPDFNPDAAWAYTTTFTPNYSYQHNRIIPPDPFLEPVVAQLHNRHPVISAAVIKRAALLSELWFQWESLVPADNGKLFGTGELAVLEQPNKSQTRPELLKLGEYHGSYAGSAFFHRTGDQVRMLNPSWVSIVLGSDRSPDDAALQLDAEVVGYMFQPGGSATYGPPEFLPANEVAHWRPEPDPVAWWRGTSWVQSILAEWAIDVAATTHTLSYFEHAATPNLVFALDASVTQTQVETYAKMIAAGHGGAANAYKSIVLGGGADVKVVGADLAALDLKSVQGLTETRIAARSQVPAVILQIAEGMQGSALNSGNYSQTRRLWGDVWFTPAANGLCAALQRILTAPGPAVRLSFDRSKIMFLQDDRRDEADILAANANAIRQLVDAGYEPATAVDAVNTSDLTKLSHSGLYSVQLQPPGTTAKPEPAALPPTA
jgi:hypothetical protein